MPFDQINYYQARAALCQARLTKYWQRITDKTSTKVVQELELCKNHLEHLLQIQNSEKVQTTCQINLHSHPIYPPDAFQTPYITGGSDYEGGSVSVVLGLHRICGVVPYFCERVVDWWIKENLMTIYCQNPT